MMFDINQLWPQDILAVQDNVQVQESCETHQLRTERPVPKEQPADESSRVETEQCFKSHALPQSMLIKTNQNELDTRQSVSIEANVSSKSEPAYDHLEPTVKHSKPQAVLLASPPASQQDVQPSTEARSVPGRGQEGTNTGRPTRHRAAVAECSQDHADSLRQGQTRNDLRRGLPGSELDQMVCEHVRKQPEGRTSEVPPIRRESPAASTSVKKKTEPYLSHSAQVPVPSTMAKPVSPTV